MSLRLRRFDRDVGLVLTAFIVLIALENLVVGVAYRAEFAGSWEMACARRFLSPMALALSVPTAVAVVALGRLAAGGHRLGPALIGGLGGAALAFGVSSGRHFAKLVVRAPFVWIGGLLAFALAFLLAAWLPRIRAGLVAILGVVVTCAAWAIDAFVLRRLYPAFHLALFFVELAACAATARYLARTFAARPLAWFGIVVALASIGWSTRAAPYVRGEDNLRRILLEHAPILGRAVLVASRLAPPPPVDDDASAATTLTQLRDRTGARAVDWRSRDVVLVTIDALRADHVSAYGYGRRTTPNIDALAARGVRFEHAYCPTPHTSYSVASMMTGKYMKPLLALDTEDESETWARQLRRYGYRTAAFYPPAVFFIDEHRFRAIHEEKLSFEYAKEEFVSRELRREQIEGYLATAPKDKPLFLWVHLFEPHEPYEMHEEHPFSGDPRLDAYDSEVASADDGVGDVVALVSEKRGRDAVFIVSADHGEEHGDHGGRYHGTTVYEEQVRVPLVVVAPGLAPRVVDTPVQTIDLLPTTLAAVDVPVPPRVRGRDLGPALVGTAPPTEQGLAFAETDDYTLVARGSDRLVCARKIASCTLFDVARDPLERQPVSDRPDRVSELRKLTAALERETGKLEASALPDALRRGMQGDRDAAEDVAPLLDDARVDIRRAAARCAFRLKAPEMAPQLRRALGRDEDGGVRDWAALALVRIGAPLEPAQAPRIEALLKSSDAELRIAAALATAEHGDARGEAELLARWTSAFVPDAAEPGELDEARELLGALAAIHSRAAAPVIVRSLSDVRLRPFVVEALANLGDLRAREPLFRTFAEERYVHLRPMEARALFRLGARERLIPALARFAGTPEPLTEAIQVAHDARLLTPDRGAMDWAPAPPPGRPARPAPRDVTASVRLATAGSARLLVLGRAGSTLSGTIGGTPIAKTAALAGDVYVVEAGELPAGEARLSLSSPGGVVAAWLVPHSPEIPPPPPRVWVASPAAATAGSDDSGRADAGL